MIAKSISGEWPYYYEGIAFDVYNTDAFYKEPVHRFYNPSLDRHFYTANVVKINDIQLTGQWNYEGIAFYGGDLYV